MNWIRHFRRGAVLCCMTAQLAACSTYRVVSVTPADLIARDHPSRIRIEAADGSRHVYYRPEIRGDSLWGRKYTNANPAYRVIALRDVTGVATPHTNTPLTVLSVGLGAAALTTLVFYVSYSNSSGW